MMNGCAGGCARMEGWLYGAVGFERGVVGFIKRGRGGGGNM